MITSGDSSSPNCPLSVFEIYSLRPVLLHEIRTVERCRKVSPKSHLAIGALEEICFRIASARAIRSVARTTSLTRSASASAEKRPTLQSATMPLPPRSSWPYATGLARLGRAERLRKLCVVVPQLAFIIHLHQTHHHALAGGHVGQYLGDKILHHLERGDRLAELQSLLGKLTVSLASKVPLWTPGHPQQRKELLPCRRFVVLFSS